MSRHSSKKDYAFVRSRRTGEVKIRRAGEFSRRAVSSLPLQERALHYIGRDRTCVCRCGNPKRHYEKTFDVASESTHLNASLKRYMNRHDLESCKIAKFQKYCRRKEDGWARQGVEVGSFHYANGEKSVVCRCAKRGTHDYGAPRNPEIIEQCADFFCLHTSRLSVLKEQWKCVDGEAPLTYSPDSQPDPFHYDSTSKSGLLNNDMQTQKRSALSPEMKMLSTAGRVAPVGLDDYRGTPQGEPEMPPKVWQNARPSVYGPRRGTYSNTSTPMGSASPSTLVFEHTIPADLPPRNRRTQRDNGISDEGTFPEIPHTNDQLRADSALDMASINNSLSELSGSNSNPRASVAEATMGARGLHEMKNTIKGPAAGFVQGARPSSRNENLNNEYKPASTPPRSESVDRMAVPFGFGTYHEVHGTPFTPHEKGDDEPQSHFSGLNENATLPSRQENYDRAFDTPVAELPARLPAELPVEHPRQRHIPTLKRLEGRNWDTASELEARRSTIRVEKAPSCMSTSTTNSARLSSLFEQVFRVVGSLPDQEGFLRHAVISSRTKPVLSENCQICNETYENRHKRTVLLTNCGHCFHEQCLLRSFRALDEKFGKCPICDLVLCERTFADRIDTDRKAIFHSQFTRLRNEVHIEFPQHGKSVSCMSEEEVAATQLRLLKDYTDVHAEELFRLWEANRAEPDWFASVVRPVVALFQGWNPAVRQSRFFAEHEAFLKLVAWAELVRLMYVTRLAVNKSEGEDAMLPRLTELHRKFKMAEDRYDKEKETWQRNSPGALGCEMITQYVVKLATDTYPP